MQQHGVENILPKDVEFTLKEKITIHAIKKDRQLLFLSLPGVIFLFIFCYYPLYGLIIAFKNYKFNLGFLKSPWVGLNNFKYLFNSDIAFRITRNVIGLNLAFIVTTLVISVLLALLLNEVSKKAVKLYQTIMFFPYFLSWVVISYVFLAILDMDHGLANNILQFLGVEPVLWYNEPVYWPFILVFANTWKGAGYFAIIYYAALISINSEYYEAARIDGANKLQQIWNISLPLMKPIISIMLLLQVGKIFYGNFDLFYNLPRDLPALYPTTDVIDTYVYRALRSTGDIGMASAAGAYQSVVGFVLVLVSNFVVKKINPENALF